MRYLLFSLCLFLGGCISRSAKDGSLKVAGIKIPGTADSSLIAGADPAKAQMIEQLAPFVWVSLILIVGGAFVGWLTNGRTGAGKFSVSLGICLIVFAVVMPQIAGWIGLLSILGLIAAVAYVVYEKIQDKKDLKEPPAPASEGT